MEKDNEKTKTEINAESVKTEPKVETKTESNLESIKENSKEKVQKLESVKNEKEENGKTFKKVTIKVKNADKANANAIIREKLPKKEEMATETAKSIKTEPKKVTNSKSKKSSKTKSKKVILKVILSIILILILIFAIHTIRNYIIITKLQKNISNYSKSTNHYIKSVSDEGNGQNVTIKYYKKDNKQVVFLEKNMNGKISKLSMYNNGERTDIFIETSDSKIAKLNSKTEINIGIYNFLETENNIQTLLESMSLVITTTKYNEKDCYCVKGFMSFLYLEPNNQTVFIEKDTGLCIKSNTNEIVNEREYQFDTIQDSIFKEPDIGQYKLGE